MTAKMTFSRRGGDHLRKGSRLLRGAKSRNRMAGVTTRSVASKASQLGETVTEFVNTIGF